MSKLLAETSSSFDDYLRDEAGRQRRHEFVNGHIWAMAGGSLNHNLIAGNAYSAMKAAAPKACAIFMSDVKVRIADDAFYPDVVASCGTHDGKALFLEQPCVIAEVSSPSTDTFDKTIKLKQYRRIKSLETYLLVATDMMAVSAHQRAGDLWTSQIYSAGEHIALPCLDMEISVDAIYAGLNLPSVDEVIAAQREKARE